MAKASASPKKKAIVSTKTTPAKKKVSTPTAIRIDKINQQALTLLQQLGVEQKLRNDIEWCLGSYGHDQNPTGLLETASRALIILKEAKAKNAKAVPAKVIADLQKVVK